MRGSVDLDPEDVRDVAQWQLQGAGSSSKVMHTLGAPVTLNKAPQSTSEGTTSAKRPGLVRQQSSDHSTGLLAQLRKASLSFPSQNKAGSPERIKITTPRSPSKGKPPLKSGLAKALSTSSEGDDDDDDDESPTSPAFVVVEQPRRSIAMPVTPIVTSPNTPLSPLNTSPHRPRYERAGSSASLMAPESEAPPGVLRTRAGSGSSATQRGSPIPSAWDGSMLSSPSFVNAGGDGQATTGAPKVEGQIEEIVPWLFQPSQGPSELSPRSRQASFSPSSAAKLQQIRSARSSSALRSTSPQDGQTSPDKKNKTKGLFQMLRRKASAGDVLRSSPGDFGADSPFSNPFPDSGPLPKPSQYPSGGDKRGKKPGKAGRTLREPSRGGGTVNAAGVQLDTNLDSMEGIVAADSLTVANDAQGEPGTNADAPRRRASALGGAGLGLAAGLELDPLRNLVNRPVSRSGEQAVNGKDGYERRGSALSLTAGSLPPVATHLTASRATNNGATGAVWTAPDSWGVHDEAKYNKSAESDDSDEESARKSTSELGTHAPNTPMLNVAAENDRANGRPGSATGRFTAAPLGRRPGTANSTVGLANGQLPRMVIQSNVRIYKQDGSHTVLSCPLNATAGDLQQMVAKKAGTSSKGVFRLYARERGLERSLAASERPLMLQRRRLEQAGYLEADKLEELGRDDHSYLIKFIYKPEANSDYRSTDDEQLDGFEYVNLEARGLQTIPIFLHRHAHELVSLNLSKNPKLDLPADFVQACTNLREMRMTDMGIKRMPYSVRLASGLTRLDVSNNRIVELDHVALDELTELLSLKASNNRLYQVPEYFGRFHSLKYLVISNNKFETLPLAVCEISSLIDLDVSFNSLTSLPNEIANLVNLERLVLFGNAITNLPGSLSELVRLRELDVRRNEIGNFAFLSDFRGLEIVKLQRNVAPVLDAAMSHVRSLNASHNPLTRLSLTGMAETLTSLVVTHAKISDLPAELFATTLTALEVLVIDNNSIRNLPEAIGSCISLMRFSCKGNHIDAIPAWIGKLQRLQHLDASNNNVASLAADIWLCGELVSLNLSSNLLAEFPDPPPMNAPEEAVVEDERKGSVASQRSGARVAAAAALSLQQLLLADNHLTDEAFQPISLMTELRVLNLSFNQLYEVPTRIMAKTTQLEELYLSGNMLTTLPEEDIAKLVNLRVLHLNSNKLQTLPAELGQLKKLHVLDVGCNVLKYNIANWKFDWNWNWNTDLRYLNLSGNKRLEIKATGSQGMHALEDSPGAARKRRNLSDFTMMKKLRVLGLMDVTLTTSTVPEDSEDRRVRTSLPEINGMGYGIADALGQSEELSIVDMIVHRFRSREDECIVGIFDGRQRARGMVSNSGSRIAKYLQDCFSSSLNSEMSRLARAKAVLAAAGADPEDLPSEAEDAGEALRCAFLNLNRDYGNILLPFFDIRRKETDPSLSTGSFNLAGGGASDGRSGATAVVVYIQGRTMHVANAGDALAVMASRGGQARLMSVKHDPSAPEEVARVRAAEGFVSTKGFVNDEIDVSRSFGHYHVFPAMNASPHVTTIEATEDDELMIIASQGLWDYMTYQSAVDCARKERADPMIAAQKLRDLAIAYGSNTNIMVMVIAVNDLFKAKQGPLMPRGRALDATDADVYAGQKGGRRGQQTAAPGERYLTLLDREVAPPVGNVALVFTDIRNSTALWETNPGMMQMAMRMHNQQLRRQLRAIGGYEVKTEGDAFMVSFPSVTCALLWCFTVQIELLREDWPQALVDSEEGREITNASGDLLFRGLSVRMGIHWGQPVCEADPITRRMDYFGPVVNKASRISGVADGGQISCSADALEVIKLVCGLDEPEAGHEETAESFEQRLAADEELDEGTKRDVLIIRKLGVGILALGERRLKGLETPENIYLLYPSQLAGRLKPLAIDTSGTLPSPEVSTGVKGGVVTTRGTEMFEPLPQLLDVYAMTQLGRLTLRMEQALNLMLHAPDLSFSPALSQGSMMRSGSLGIRRRAHPLHLHSPVPIEAGDDELVLFLENFVVRIENLVAALQLRQLGPYNDVLSALASVTQIDSRQLVQALSMFATCAR